MIVLGPSKLDSQKGRRREKKLKDKPAVTSGVFDEFERLQQQLKLVEKENKAISESKMNLDLECDHMENDKLMHRFQQIEKMESQRRWKEEQRKKNLRNRSCHLAQIIPKGSGANTNDWFVDFNANANEVNMNEPFSSLLDSQKTATDVTLIERKKKIYEDKEADNEDNVTCNESKSSIGKKKNGKKKVFTKVAKLMRRKKKSGNEDEGSFGIASICSSMNTGTTDGANSKKKKRFKFLSSLRRKNRKGGNQDSASLKMDSSQIFEEEPEDDGKESFVIDNVGMMEHLEDRKSVV